MLNKQIPQGLQAVLWSKSLDTLDYEKDKSYIINQVLAYGLLEHIHWLFKTYSKNTIIETFLKNPIKTYSARSLNFIKIILFGDKPINLDENQYVQYSL